MKNSSGFGQLLSVMFVMRNCENKQIKVNLKKKEVEKLWGSVQFGRRLPAAIRNALCKCFWFTGLDRNTTPMYTLYLRRESQKTSKWIA